MMSERGMSVDHTTIYGWVQAYAPELDKRNRNEPDIQGSLQPRNLQIFHPDEITRDKR